MRRILSALVVGVALAALPSLALAQSAPCYEVVSASQGTLPDRVVLADRCSGKTWVLSRTQVHDAKGKPISGEFSYSWSPIPVDTNVAILQFGVP
jgi:hypothetical protein